MKKYKPANIWFLIFTGLNVLFTLIHHYNYNNTNKKIQQRWNPVQYPEPKEYTGPVFETAESLQK